MSPRRCRRPRPEACRPPVSLACSTRPRSRGSAGLPSTWASSSASSSSRWYWAASRRSRSGCSSGCCTSTSGCSPIRTSPRPTPASPSIAPAARRHWFLLLGLPPLVFAATASVSCLHGGVLVAQHDLLLLAIVALHPPEPRHRPRLPPRRAARDPRPRPPERRASSSASRCGACCTAPSSDPQEFYETSPWIAQVDVPGPLVVVSRRPRDRRPRRCGPCASSASRPPRHFGRPGTPCSCSRTSPSPPISYLLDLRHHRRLALHQHLAQRAVSAVRVGPERPAASAAAASPRGPSSRGLCQPASACATPRSALALGGTFYFLLGLAADSMAWQTLPLVLICHQTVNFHHYIVDAVIWRSPRPAPAR
jgi:hypothetical protein